MKLGAQDQKLLESVKRGEWESAAGGKRERTRFSRYAKATYGTALSSDQHSLLYSTVETAGSNLMLVDNLQR